MSSGPEPLRPLYRASNWGGGDGHAMGTWDEGSSGINLCDAMTLPMANEEGRRTERIFRCAGCIGGYECSIHGRRL